MAFYDFIIRMELSAPIILKVKSPYCFILMDSSSGGKLVNTSPEWSVWHQAENEKRPLDTVCVFIGFEKKIP